MGRKAKRISELQSVANKEHLVYVAIEMVRGYVLRTFDCQTQGLVSNVLYSKAEEHQRHSKFQGFEKICRTIAKPLFILSPLSINPISSVCRMLLEICIRVLRVASIHWELHAR